MTRAMVTIKTEERNVIMPGPEDYRKEVDRLMGYVEERASLSGEMLKKGMPSDLAEARATRIVKSSRAHKNEPLDF
jgi:hypothetical protein